MKLHLLQLAITLTLFSCNPSNNSGLEKEGLKDKQINTELNGYWSVKIKHLDYSKTNRGLMPITDSPRISDTVEYHHNETWLIRRDSIYVFEYPCEFKNSHKYNIVNDSIYFDGLKKAFAQIKMTDNILEVKVPGDDRTPVEVYHFERDSINEQVITTLINYKYNKDCLPKSYTLIKQFNPADEDIKDIVFPFKLPELILIDDSLTLSDLLYKKEIFINIKAQKKAFTVKNVIWENSDYVFSLYPTISTKPILIFEPAAWWKGDKFEVVYAAYP